MANTGYSRFKRVSVVFEKRPDGGLRVYSPDVPGFRLSHRDSSLVTSDIIPALEVIIGAMVGKPVRVLLDAPQIPLPDASAETTKIDYITSIAA
jgi:hypothetical protein